MNTVLYLYGFVPSDAPNPPASVPGIDDRAVELVALGSFAAAVSEVDAASFGEGRIEERLKHLGWVGRHGARHETVVTWLSDHAAIVPARLLTVFSSLEALRAEASGRSGVIEELLERFRDEREWDLKVSYDADKLMANLGEHSEEAAEEEAEIEAALPGRRYLLERRREEHARGQAAEVARRVARDVLDRLGEVASEVMELELPQLRGEARVVLNAALLVRPGRADELQHVAAEAAHEFEPHGIEVALTGPWAPYRFLPEVADG